jgi:hypothetical protein
VISHRQAGAEWLGSPNFWADREGHDMAIQPAYVIIHTMVGTIASANSRFQIPAQGASAHYGVGYDGRLVQWVDEKDAAWHAGNATINLDSIGIEHEDMGRYNDPRPDALYATSARLVHDICRRYGIPIDHAHIRPHREVSDSPTACPDALDVGRIVTMAATGGETMALVGLDPADPIVDALQKTVLDQGNSTNLLGMMRSIWNWTNPGFSTQKAIADALAGIAGGQAAIKVEVDNVAAAQAGGTPADLGALQAAIAGVDHHVAALRTHLGDTAP